MSVYGIIMLSFSVLDMIITPTLAARDCLPCLPIRFFLKLERKRTGSPGRAGRAGGGYKKTYVRK